MKKLIDFIVRSIVTKPKVAKVKEEKSDGLTTYQLQVDPEDLKIIIGKRGRTIRAIRQLVRLKAINQGKRVNLTLIENSKQASASESKKESSNGNRKSFKN